MPDGEFFSGADIVEFSALLDLCLDVGKGLGFFGLGGAALVQGLFILAFGMPSFGRPIAALGLALIAVALWLAYAAGSQP